MESITQAEESTVRSRMQSLREEGLLLLGNKMLKPIKALSKKDKQDPPLYELVCRKNLRICTYFDRDRQTFVYLTGWKKQKPIQPDDVARCRRLLSEYLEIMREGDNGK